MGLLAPTGETDEDITDVVELQALADAVLGGVSVDREPFAPIALDDPTRFAA